MNRIAKALYHAIFWPRFRSNRSMKRFAGTVPSGSRVLEFGSGKPEGGSYPYSVARFFKHCEFLQTDVVPEFGHTVADITSHNFHEEFDVILASSVLEHVFDYEGAIDGIYRALKPGGLARISVPFLFPLHDEPRDYWRFTEHALRRLLDEFQTVVIRAVGLRRAPWGYCALATK